MSNCRLAKTSINSGVANFLTLYENLVEKNTIAYYQSAIRDFMQPAMDSCPDLVDLVGVLSYFCSNPGPIYVELVKYVLQYISGTLALSLKFDGEANTPNDVVRQTDFIFARLKTDKKSTRGYTFILVRATISHLLKLQSIIALSICEVEYIATYKARKKAVARIFIG